MDLFKKEKESESEEQPQRGHREAQRQDDRPVQRGQRPMGQPGKPEKKRNPLKGIGLAAVAVLVATFFLTGKSATVDTSLEAQNALKTGTSSTLEAGTRLLEADGDQLSGRDYDVTIQDQGGTGGQPGGSVNLYVWDYAAEDGDYVQVIFNGKPLGDAFMIKHAAKIIPLDIVPGVPVKLQVKGVKDGGGGITYAAMFHYKQHHFTYFNMAPMGGNNTYTITLVP